MVIIQYFQLLHLQEVEQGQVLVETQVVQVVAELLNLQTILQLPFLIDKVGQVIHLLLVLLKDKMVVMVQTVVQTAAEVAAEVVEPVKLVEQEVLVKLDQVVME
tara:strand:- start:245 stop:556 length:312 start_codon:yes stop_codon:yes gene_type:complete